MVVSGVLLLLQAQGWAAYALGLVPARFTLGTVTVQGQWLLPVWLTPLGATLLHGGWLHLLMNCVTFFYTGQFVERALGKGGVVTLYLLGAYAAAGAQWAVDPLSPVPMVGASGAIAAILAAYALLFAQSQPRAIGPIPARIVQGLGLAVTWVVLNWMLSLVGEAAGMPIAAAAHIGGFFLGLLLARPLLLWRWRQA